jgi:hypothetical protein
MYEQEKAYYASHKAEFHEKYPDKWIVITGNTLWGAFDTSSEAIKNVAGNLKQGEFMLHKPAHDGNIVIGKRSNIQLNKKRKKKAKPTIKYTNEELVVFPYA